MRDQIEKINREADVKEFINDFPQAFKSNIPLQFEPAAIDSFAEIIVDDVTKISLGKFLGQLLSKDEQLAATQIIKDNELVGANALIVQYTQNPDLGNPTQSREMIVEIQNQQDELYAQREVLKAQIDALLALNVVPIIETKKDTKGIISENHEAAGDDQITVKAGEEVMILEQNAGSVKVQTATGLVGWIPAQKVTINQPAALSGPAPKTVVAEFEFVATEEGELSFQVGDEIECLEGVAADEEWWEGKLLSTGATGTFPVRFTKGWEAVAAGWGGGMARQQSIRNISPSQKAAVLGASNLQRQSSNLAPLKAEEAAATGFSAKALYAYEASCPGELTIEAGEIILNVSTETGSEQWWEGSGLNGRGQFPMSYVEKIDLTKAAKVKAIYDYQSTNQGDLSFKAGDIISVIQSDVPLINIRTLIGGMA